MRFPVIAAAAGVLAAFAGLLAFGQSVEDRWYQAIRQNDLAGVRAMANAGSVDEKDKRGNTPLMDAAAYGSIDAMRSLIDKGANVNAANAFGATALMLAVNEADKARLLVEHGADVNARSKMGRTALLLAAGSDGASATVRLLLEHGAKADVRDDTQGTPLLAATAANDIATLRLLLDKGADVNAANAGGFTPLMNAAANGNLEAVGLLLARGANVNVVSKPETDRVKNGPVALGSLTALHMAATYGPAEVVRALLDAGAGIDPADVRGVTPLMLAVATDHADARIVRLLVGRGADLARKDKGGRTAADWARLYNAPEILRELKLKPAPVPATTAILPTAATAGHRADEAAAKALDLLRHTNETFFKEGGCISCHAQNVTATAVQAAATHRIPVHPAPDPQANPAALFFSTLEQPLLQRGDPPVVDILMSALFQMAAEGVPASRATDAMVYNIAAQQRRTGNWHVGLIARPPMEDGDFTRTAMGIRILDQYGPAGRKADSAARIERAARWLAAARPTTTEDLTMQLLGIRWAGGRVPEDGTNRLLAAQRGDGGWGQTRNLPSDAYATGTVLYALHELGVPPSAPEYRRGVDFLLRTQSADGSWHVASRVLKFQPYFESDFPYAHDQWISSDATAWASTALSYAAGREEVARR